MRETESFLWRIPMLLVWTLILLITITVFGFILIGIPVLAVLFLPYGVSFAVLCGYAIFILTRGH